MELFVVNWPIEVRLNLLATWLAGAHKVPKDVSCLNQKLILTSLDSGFWFLHLGNEGEKPYFLLVSNCSKSRSLRGKLLRLVSLRADFAARTARCARWNALTAKAGCAGRTWKNIKSHLARQNHPVQTLCLAVFGLAAYSHGLGEVSSCFVMFFFFSRR